MPLFNTGLFNAALFGGPAALSGFQPREVGKGLLYPALRKAAITIGPQRTPSPAQFQDAIEELNRLIGMLNCGRLFIYSLDILELPLAAGQKVYTIGLPPTGTPPADWNVPRPQLISEANAIDPAATGSPVRYPLRVFRPEEWSAIQQQNLATIPEGIYDDYAYPLSNIYVYGQPAGAMTLELYVWHQIPTFQSLTDVVLLPLQYEDALVLNLACRLAPHFQREVHPDVREQAVESLAAVKRLNNRAPLSSLSGVPGSGCCGTYDIYSDR